MCKAALMCRDITFVMCVFAQRYWYRRWMSTSRICAPGLRQAKYGFLHSHGWNNEILAGIRDFGMDFSDLIVLVVLLAS
jgi:hypothetical protein